ncbi:MAG: hypothetical protein ACRD96_28045 [Bryobacteraceae bacterium]
MAKEEGPLEYERRIRDTKGVAQRLDLDYLGRPNRLSQWRRRLALWTPVAAVAIAAPFVAGIGDGEKAFSNGPVSRSHTMFETNCSACHASRFSSVADASCQKCHDGPAHPAKAADTGKPRENLRCAACHVEHRGTVVLAGVSDRNCTFCHADLTKHGEGVRIVATNVTRFRPGKHPEFQATTKRDLRPLRLNHAVHMPEQPKTIRNMKLPMKCGDCHATDLANLRGDLAPVTFEKHCRSCHERELEFDVYQALGASTPAPHSKDTEEIRAFVKQAYAGKLAADPGVAARPLGRDFVPSGSPAAWLEKVQRDSEAFLFERKCKYCHEYEDTRDGVPVIKKVNEVRGHYLDSAPAGEAWLLRGEFSHRAHRAAECASCHTTARASVKTTDVLIPKMEACLPCHGATGTYLDNCAQCHLYHNKSREADKDRRPVEQLAP